MQDDKVFLLDVGDGPEGIQIYTSEEEGVVDWSQTFPPVYLEATLWGARVKLGPFTLGSIHTQLKERLKS
jgi:hypothetical protein